MLTREALVERIDGGASFDYLFFWGHTPKRPNVVDASCLSQWFPADFSVDGVDYPTAEHFMMMEKARLFKDDIACERLLHAGPPAIAKEIGRSVRNYDDDAWASARVDAVVRGNLAKFGQNSDLARFLLGTQKRVLVEASPRDRIWGIGLGKDNPAARDPRRWRGQNLLGFALMDVRERLAEKA
ncbi:NADAR family protein [Pendulispora brunnea]|uniref:NADAR family protein n=1 Tax=Pendulispora brunnea TaxID=2905690 RepID=A0ABZ2KDS1_9BACT